MKKIKIIDLLNKIANGEEVPEQIIYHNNIYYMVGNSCYENYEIEDEPTLIYAINNTNHLNDEVEIIEDAEEDEGIKKIDTNIPCSYEIETTLRDKLNEVIDIVNKLNKKEGK